MHCSMALQVQIELLELLGEVVPFPIILAHINEYCKTNNFTLVMKSTKCKPSAEFGGWYIRKFGLKTPCMHMY